MRLTMFLSLIAVALIPASDAFGQVTNPVTIDDLILQIDQDGRGRLVNKADVPIGIDGYSITDDPAGRLDSAAWTSLTDQFLADSAGMLARYGSGVATFAEVPTVGPALLAELNLGGVALIQPGDVVELGLALPSNLPIGFVPPGLGFSFSGGGAVINGNIQVLPEPSSWALTVTGLVVLASMGRRAGSHGLRK